MKYNKDEGLIKSQLASLYERRGYKKYKPGCFEEYSLYQENIDFLISKNVITFSDLDGRLLAMRPDVTLSIIKHNDVNAFDVDKYFYSESVYRQAKGSKNYREISQIGVEVVGAVDGASIAELTCLACETLKTISSEYLLDISHMGFTEGLFDEFGAESELVAAYLEKKNIHDFLCLAEENNYSSEKISAFKFAVAACGNLGKAVKEAEAICLNDKMRSAVAELKTLYLQLKDFGLEDCINVNFSAAGNADYYNGIIFNGYLKGVPHCVLTGGRYDRLLNKMGKKGGAVGFAIYLGEIERFFVGNEDTIDYLIVYDESTQSNALNLSKKYIDEGKSVRISKSLKVPFKCLEIINLTGGVK